MKYFFVGKKNIRKSSGNLPNRFHIVNSLSSGGRTGLMEVITKVIARAYCMAFHTLSRMKSLQT
jgi:hypothetical protein